MISEKKPKILIVTAAFGDGHNSAARNLAEALQMVGCHVRVADPCMLAYPKLTGYVNQAYRMVTTHMPTVWAWIYEMTAELDFRNQKSSVLKAIERQMLKLVEDEQPDLVVSTYPLYPYFTEGMRQVAGVNLPVWTVVTDSIEINAAWRRLDTDLWCVTDQFTVDVMVGQGIAGQVVKATGFPVSPKFAAMTSVAESDLLEDFRVLYLPTAKVEQLGSDARAILEADAKVRLTMVLGRNTRGLYHVAKEVKDEFPGRVKLIGWSKRLPTLMSQHHVMVGKAGGATVHEAIAACIPMLIHHLVPGQEEGNLELLEKLGSGSKALSPERLLGSIRQMLADDGRGWRQMKLALKHHGMNRGAQVIASMIQERLQQGRVDG